MVWPLVCSQVEVLQQGQSRLSPASLDRLQETNLLSHHPRISVRWLTAVSVSLPGDWLRPLSLLHLPLSLDDPPLRAVKTYFFVLHLIYGPHSPKRCASKH